MHLLYQISFHVTMRNRIFSIVVTISLWDIPFSYIDSTLSPIAETSFFLLGTIIELYLLVILFQFYLEMLPVFFYITISAICRLFWTFIIRTITKMMIHFTLKYRFKQRIEKIFESFIHIFNSFQITCINATFLGFRFILAKIIYLFFLIFIQI